MKPGTAPVDLHRIPDATGEFASRFIRGHDAHGHVVWHPIEGLPKLTAWTGRVGPAGQGRFGPHLVEFRVGEQSGAEQEPDAFRGFQGKAATPSGLAIDG